MLKKSIYLIIIFFSVTFWAQKKSVLFSKSKKIYPKINIPFSADTQVSNAADEFNSNFKLVTGEYLKIERSNSLNSNNSYILLRINPTQKSDFCIYKKGENITIQGATVQNLVFGITDFFKRYTSLNFQKNNNPEKDRIFATDLSVPNQFNVCGSPKFEYREPYFLVNF